MLQISVHTHMLSEELVSISGQNTVSGLDFGDALLPLLGSCKVHREGGRRLQEEQGDLVRLLNAALRN